ncbi:heavy-metal-associated domain-containing protein [Paenibacillus sp. FSL R7-0297]|uniref:heavy-metal-associated domain-containing protein n=1 Tax=unclassified Paenibacillus TaxID=185978 RepID=UPI0030FC5806
MTTTTFQLEQLTCPGCIKKIETALTHKDGVSGVKVLFTSSKVKVSHNETIINSAGVSKVITNLGFPILSFK